MITFAQLDPSAQAPWTRTTVASLIAILAPQIACVSQSNLFVGSVSRLYKFME